MNLRKINWWKTALMLALTAFFLYASIEMGKAVPYYYSNWIVNQDNVQERAYEALSLLASACILLLIFGSCFLMLLRSLIHCFFPLKRPSVFARLTDRFGGYPTLIAFAVFCIFFIIQLFLYNVFMNTPEVTEVPVTLHYRIISCWLSLPLVLTFETTMVMLVSWIQSKLRKTKK